MGFLSPRTFMLIQVLTWDQLINIFSKRNTPKNFLNITVLEGPILEMNEEYVWNSDKDGFLDQMATLTSPL